MAAKQAKVSEHAKENIKTFAIANFNFSIKINFHTVKILKIRKVVVWWRTRDSLSHVSQ